MARLRRLSRQQSGRHGSCGASSTPGAPGCCRGEASLVVATADAAREAQAAQAAHATQQSLEARLAAAVEELAAQLAVAEAAEAARAQAVEAAAASLSTPPEYLRSVVLFCAQAVQPLHRRRACRHRDGSSSAVLQLPTVDAEHLDASLARLSASADSWLERTVGTAGAALLPHPHPAI